MHNGGEIHWKQIYEAECNLSIYEATLNLNLIYFRGDHEWKERIRRDDSFYTGPGDNSFYTVPTFWERSNSFCTAPRYRIKNFEPVQGTTVFTPAQGTTVFTPAPMGQQFLHRPDILRKEQQLSHRSQIQNKKFGNAQVPAKRGCNIWRRRGRSRRAAWKGVTKNSKTPILSHSQLLGGWVG